MHELDRNSISGWIESFNKHNVMIKISHSTQQYPYILVHTQYTAVPTYILVHTQYIVYGLINQSTKATKIH